MFNVSEILESTNGKLLNGDINEVVSTFSKDSRKIEKGDFYIPIVGENFDGNKYSIDCISSGAIGCFVDEGYLNSDAKMLSEIIKINNQVIVIQVENSLKAMQQLAMYNREKCKDTIVIGITGSVGKTSTKEIIASVVQQQYSTLKTEGNLNNNIGLPLMLLKLEKQEVAILEMGMNSKGEISLLTNIARPNIGCITNIGTSHIGILGSQENIFSAKMEIIEGIKKDGVLILNGDDKFLNTVTAENLKIYRYEILQSNGNKESNKEKLIAYNINIDDDVTMFSVNIAGKEEVFTINAIGEYNVQNALCAISIGLILKIDIEKIKKGILEFKNIKMRMESFNLSDNILLVNDAYNANFDSMTAGVQYVLNSSRVKKILILGDMLELGDYSYDLHYKIGKQISTGNVDLVLLYGKESEAIYKGIKDSSDIECYQSTDKLELEKILFENIEKDSLIFLKASRGMALETIANKIIDKYKLDLKV